MSTTEAPKPHGKVTLYDVAAAAGVSQPTASRVLNGTDRRVSAEFRRRVLKAARELGYMTNVSAQAVARGTSRMIAFVVGDIAGTYFSSMAAAIMREARAHGYRVSISVTERKPDRELQVVRELKAQRPSAIVFAGSGFVHPAAAEALVDELQRFQALGGRVLQVSRADMPFAVVAFDNHQGARTLGVELGRLGYRSALVLGSVTPLLGMRQRVDGFLDGFRSSGGERGDVREVPLNWNGGRTLVEGLSEADLREHDVIFAVTDDLALGVIAGLRERGVGFPSEIAVAGFNDISTLRDISPPLTTVHVPLDLVAERTVRWAIDGVPAAEEEPIPTHPVLRESTPRRAAPLAS